MKNLILGLFLLSASAFGQEDKVHLVSIINLIATPERFDGKVVAVNGELNIHLYGLTPPVWLSLSSHVKDIYSMIHLNIPAESLESLLSEQGKFYRVVGVFSNCSAPIVDGKACYLSITPNRVGPDQQLDMRTYD